MADRAALEEVFEQYDFDAVIHFAGFKAVGESVKQPLKYYRNNLDTTLTLLETMAYHRGIPSCSAPPPRSTACRRPSPTEDMPTGCTNPYGWTKYMIEQILRDQAAAHPELSVVLLRYFNPIGAHPSGLIGELPQGIPNNLLPYVSGVASGRLEKLHVFGNDYPTPTAPVSGITSTWWTWPAATWPPCATPPPTPARRCSTWVRAADTACWTSSTPSEAANGVSVPYVIDPRRPGDIDECYAATEKAEKLLGWRAEKELEEMCRDAWRWETSLR